jgi:predicted nucleic acid-binding Zn ribbon protein
MSKVCKKCGKEIPQDSKKNVCESCQNESNRKLRKFGEGLLTVGGTALGVIVLIVTKGKFGNPKT